MINRRVLFLRSMAVLPLFVFAVRAEKIGTIQLGTDILLGNTVFETSSQRYKVSPVGPAVGFCIPVKFPVVDVYYKVRVAYHPAIRNDTDVIFLRSYEQKTHYLSALNAVEVGRRFRLGQAPLSLLPLCGLGMSIETTYKDYGKGIVYDLVFIDFSALLKYSFRTCETGILIDFQHGFFSSNKYYQARNKLDVSLVFSL